MTLREPAKPFRSREWFAAPEHIDAAALYLERFMNYGVTPDELHAGEVMEPALKYKHLSAKTPRHNH